MAFEKLNSKLDRHFARLAEGGGRKIKATDVGKIIAKLEKRKAKLLQEVTESPHKAERLSQKIAAADQMLARANWLQEQLQGSVADAVQED